MVLSSQECAKLFMPWACSTGAILALAQKAPRVAMHLYSGLLWEPKPQEAQLSLLWGTLPRI